MKPITVVFGASNNPDRYSYKATISLLSRGHKVVPIGVKKGSIAEIDIINEHIVPSSVDTLTLYVNPKIQAQHQDYLLSLNPRRVIFNPGTENPLLLNKYKAQGSIVENACTLVLLNTDQY